MGVIVWSSGQGLRQYQDSKRKMLDFLSDSHNLGVGVKMREVGSALGPHLDLSLAPSASSETTRHCFVCVSFLFFCLTPYCGTTMSSHIRQN